MNPHLKQINSEREQADPIGVQVGLSPRKAKRERHISNMDFQNFKQLVHDTTGVATKNQKLIHATRRLSDDEKTLADYGIGQGAVVICHEHKEPQGPQLELASTHARGKLFECDPDGLIRGKLGSLASSLNGSTLAEKSGVIKARMMLRWNQEKNPQILHHDNDNGMMYDREMAYVDYDADRRHPTCTDKLNYCHLRDNGIYDHCDPIRHRFEYIEKAAAATKMAAQAARVNSAPPGQQ